MSAQRTPRSRMGASTLSAVTDNLAERLRNVCVGVRGDLEVSRHIMQGRPSYVIRDPLTFRSHRLDAADYDVFVRLNETTPLGDVFTQWAAAHEADASQEEPFYQFILTLHRLGFLQLPISDERQLYRRYAARREAAARGRLARLLFCRIPLFKPDVFLQRTIIIGRILFSKPMFVAWAVLMLAAAYVGCTTAALTATPLDALWTAGNLPAIWITLIVLKLFHEFGHAYACRACGVHVPEMGAYLILGTPCAYVDASASWGLSRRRQRILICLAGMYVESFFAALAVFICAASDSQLVRSLAFNVILLAGTVTVVFNVNPLMRYDGYYILSDLVSIPNLRQRALAFVKRLAARRLLGVNAPLPPVSRRDAAILTIYGASSAIYRVMLLAGIAALLAWRLGFLGLFLAACFVGGALIGVLRAAARYLWFAEETRAVRVRAVAVSLLLFVGLPAAAAKLPLPAAVHASGVLTREREAVVRNEAPGFVHSDHAEPAAVVRGGETLIALENDDVALAVTEAAARLDEALIRYNAALAENAADAQQQADRVAALREALSYQQSRAAALQVTAPFDGEVVSDAIRDINGRFCRVGTAFATLVAGDWHVRTLLSQAEFDEARPQPGDFVEFRPAGRPAAICRGSVVRVEPAGRRRIDLSALTTQAGGDILVDPSRSEAGEPYFEVVIRIENVDRRFLRFNMTGRVRFPAEPAPIVRQLYRRLLTFADRMRQA